MLAASFPESLETLGHRLADLHPVAGSPEVEGDAAGPGSARPLRWLLDVVAGDAEAISLLSGAVHLLHEAVMGVLTDDEVPDAEGLLDRLRNTLSALMPRAGEGPADSPLLGAVSDAIVEAMMGTIRRSV